MHGHSYRSEVTIRGSADPSTGMVIDLGFFERALAGARGELDHRFLDDVPDLGPATMENLSAWIWRKVSQIGRHTSELQSLMRISYAVFCLKTKNRRTAHQTYNNTALIT